MPENQTRNLLVKKDWFYIIISWSVLMLGFIGILYYAPGYLRQLRSQDPAQYSMSGLQYFKEKKYDQAIENLRLGLELAPENSDMNFLLGRALDEKKDFPKAEKYLKKAIELQPDNIGYINALSWHYTQSAQWEQVEQLWLGQLKKEPGNLAYLSQLASIYTKMKLPEKAISMYQKVYTTDPRSMEAIQGLAKNYTLVHKNDKALEFWLKIVASHPEDSNAWYNLGRLWDEKKNFKKAEDAFKQALLLDDENYYYNLSMARLYFRTGNPSGMLQAEKYLAQSTTASPNQFEPYYMLGLIHRDVKKNYPMAVILIKAALKNKVDVYGYRDLGAVYEKLNQPQEALKAYKKVLEIDPGFPIQDRISRLSKSS